MSPTETTTCLAACRVPPNDYVRQCPLPAGHRCSHAHGSYGDMVVWDDTGYTINPMAIEVVRLSDGSAPVSPPSGSAEDEVSASGVDQERSTASSRATDARDATGVPMQFSVYCNWCLRALGTDPAPGLVYCSEACARAWQDAHAEQGDEERLLQERYWCGCVREARWHRCAHHLTLDHDEEPPRRTEHPEAGELAVDRSRSTPEQSAVAPAQPPALATDETVRAKAAACRQQKHAVMCDHCGAGPTPFLKAGFPHHCGGTWTEVDALAAQPAARREGGETEHDLKVWSMYGDALDSGAKTFEFRRDDREPRFEVGDLLRLREWGGARMEYKGREWWRRVTYVARGGVIPEGFCVMAVVPATPGHPDARELAVDLSRSTPLSPDTATASARSAPAPEGVETLDGAWVVWSNYHDGWWGPDRSGYTNSLLCAGVYSEEEAKIIERTRSREAGGEVPEKAVSLAVALETERLTRISTAKVVDLLLAAAPRSGDGETPATVEGFRRLDAEEVWTNDRQLVVLGQPADVEDENDPAYHNCDAMGCGSVGAHVIVRAPLPGGPHG